MLVGSGTDTDGKATSGRRIRRTRRTSSVKAGKWDSFLEPWIQFQHKDKVKWGALVVVAALAWFGVITLLLGTATRRHSSSQGGWQPDGGRFLGGGNGRTAQEGWNAGPAAEVSVLAAERKWGQSKRSNVQVNFVNQGPLASANDTLPHADLLLAIFSGDNNAGKDKRELLRQIYDKYEGWVTVGGKNSKGTNKVYEELTFRVVFVVSRESAPIEGEMVGDVMYVPVPAGYRNIVLKTKRMLCLVKHFRFRYLLKADDDTFVCIQRLASFLHDQPEYVKPRLYAGVPTACHLATNPNTLIGRVIMDPTDRWFDEKFVNHTLRGLECFPVYMQGAFYVLAHPLVEHLYRGLSHYVTFTNEDVTIGSWLLGVDRELVQIHDIMTAKLWECVCAKEKMLAKHRNGHVFFHNCKQDAMLRLCASRLLRPRVGC